MLFRSQAKWAGYPGAKTAGVAFVQRFGGALNCNVHAHALLPDGVFILGPDGSDGPGGSGGSKETLTFVPLAPPEDEDLLPLAVRIARRVTAFLDRRFAAREPNEADVLEAAIGEGLERVSRPASVPATASA